MIGKFQHRCQVQELTTQDDGFAVTPDVWATSRDEFFSLQPLRGDEAIAAAHQQSQVTHKGICHFFSGANSKMRVKLGDRIFYADSVVNQFERNGYLEWKLVEVVDNA